jgi:lauroyl/myristoyl acyltransferase
LKDGHYRCEVVDVIPAADARDIWGTTQRCLKDLEKIIRRHPSCWVLNYNCFRKQPTEKELAELQKRETTASMP